MPLPADYAERVYAGVLGKLIGVYLGRPFEGRSYDWIMRELGEIRQYVHERRGQPLIVTDDDIAGTFTFVRALADYGCSRDLTPAQIGQTWLNYLVEGRTVLWWGGLGNSTEHTAYIRLKNGIAAPRSGSAELNSKLVAEQIGAQIFIDGWAMVAPGDPELAASLARRAASVSHDGEAVYAAQVVAAMEAQAFVEPDMERLVSVGTSFMPRDSVIYRLIDDIRGWRELDGDWRRTRERIEERYGYDKYGGNCHVVPNHGLIILAALYGGGDFTESLAIVNTSGWDTDCNSGNVGCLLGIRTGLDGIGAAWREPVADRLFISGADGGRAVSDAATEAIQIINMGRALQGERPVAPKGGARFHFELPGSVQGFRVEEGTAALANVAGHSRLGQRALAVRPGAGAGQHVGGGGGVASGDERALTAQTGAHSVLVSVDTFIPPEAINMKGYGFQASPSLYPGQTVRVGAAAGAGAPVRCRLYLRSYGAGDQVVTTYGPAATLQPGAAHEWRWRVPDCGGPIVKVGIEVDGEICLDYLTWEGAPDVTWSRPAGGGTMWARAWVDGVSQFERFWPESFRLVQNEGTGLLIQGAREWQDYQVTATVNPHLVESGGIAARVQGLRRYYALVLRRSGKVQLVRALDGETVLAEANVPWALGGWYKLSLRVRGSRIEGFVEDRLLLVAQDGALDSGAVALVCEEGRLGCDRVEVHPA
jgi:hypothetical protein